MCKIKDKLSLIGEIAGELSKIERDQIGFCTPKEKLLSVAYKLKDIMLSFSNNRLAIRCFKNHDIKNNCFTKAFSI